MNPWPDNQSVLIVDNCRIHHNDTLVDLVHSAGLFLVSLINVKFTHSFSQDAFWCISHHICPIWIPLRNRLAPVCLFLTLIFARWLMYMHSESISSSQWKCHSGSWRSCDGSDGGLWMYHSGYGGRLVSTCWLHCISLWFEAENGAVSCICVIEVLYEMQEQEIQ